MLHDITPLIISYNEEANLGRTLAALSWARDIVVVDSHSTDATPAILAAHARVRTFQHHFDSHAKQWTYALGETGIRTPWVLALDADYVLSDALIAELAALRPPTEIDAYRARFDYYVRGRRLWGSLYPPVTVLFRRDRASYVQDGHAQRLQVPGAVGALHAPIAHDDRKPFAHWRATQRRYARLEAEKLARAPWFSLGWSGRVRRLIVVAPAAALLYCLVVRGGLLQGLAGLQYAFLRAWAETVIAQELLKVRFSGR